MQKLIQIRHVPPETHRKLKARAALAGMSLSDYLLREIERLANQPTPDEIRTRLAKLPRVELPEPAAALVRRERDAR